jgi:hypothetical protein
METHGVEKSYGGWGKKFSNECVIYQQEAQYINDEAIEEMLDSLSTCLTKNNK